MQNFSIAACTFVLSGILSAAIVAADLWRRPQPMRIMNAVWTLTPLWAGVLGLAAYFSFGRAGKRPAARTDRSAAGMEPMPDRMHAGGTGAQMGNMDRMDTSVGLSVQKSPAQTIPAPMSSAPMTPAPTSTAPTSTAPMSTAPMSMDMAHSEGMHGMPEMEMEMEMGAPRPRWQSVVLSTLHCGAGCTLADLVGEWFLYFVPVVIGGSLLAGTWVTDYLLALVFGIGFQYAAIRGMERIPRGEAVLRAAKADFLSLTAWQAGMYGWMAVAMFALGDGAAAPRTTFWFWFMMQIAMCCGFLVSLPVNVLLIRRGIKKGM